MEFSGTEEEAPISAYPFLSEWKGVWTQIWMWKRILSNHMNYMELGLSYLIIQLCILLNVIEKGPLVFASEASTV